MALSSVCNVAISGSSTRIRASFAIRRTVAASSDIRISLGFKARLDHKRGHAALQPPGILLLPCPRSTADRAGPGREADWDRALRCQPADRFALRDHSPGQAGA